MTIQNLRSRAIDPVFIFLGFSKPIPSPFHPIEGYRSVPGFDVGEIREQPLQQFVLGHS
jgi:hypothetical protein